MKFCLKCVTINKNYIIIYIYIYIRIYIYIYIYIGCTSGLLVKVLGYNRKVAGSNPTRCRLFFTHEYTQLHPQNEDVLVTASFRGDVKPLLLGSWLILATGAIPASPLATFGKTLREIYISVLISGVNLYYKAQFGTFVSVLNTGVSSIEGFHCIYISYMYIIMYMCV